MSLLKNALLCCVFIVSIITIIILVRTFAMSPKQHDLQECKKSDFDFIEVNNDLLERFQQSLRYQTVSVKPHDYNRDELKNLQNFIIEAFSKLHSSSMVEFEIVANYSLLYTIKGSNSALTPYLLMAHLDVVPANSEKWTSPPFSADIIDKFIYARGAIDFKHGVMGILEALNFYISRGQQPERGFYVAFGHDEEVSGYDGAKAISDLLWERGVHKLEYIVDEGLTITHGIVPGMSSPVALIGISEKGYLDLELKVVGIPGHSSMPPPESTIGILANAVARLERNSHPSMFGYGPEKETFEHLASYMKFPQRVVMSNLWLFGPLVSWFMSQRPVTNAIVRTTTAVTMFNAGIKINVNAPVATAYVNHRIHPAQNLQQVIEYDRSVISDDRVNITVVTYAAPHPISPSGPDAFGYQVVKASIQQIWGGVTVAPGSMIGNTDTKHYLHMTNNIYRFSPTVTYNNEDLKRFHGDNERISIQNYEQCINFYYHLISNANKQTMQSFHQHIEF